MSETAEPGDPLQALLAQVLQRWRERPYPPPLRDTLESELRSALTAAAQATPEIIDIATTTARPARLQLAVLTADADIDTMYALESVELAVAASGVLYLVYRRRMDVSYAVPWTSSVTLPGTLMTKLSPAMATALLEGD
ncbi:MAG: hypothetical protein ACOCZK_01000 [Planctomycetota bacterium]